jgi:phosphopantetheine adenylyltransferase
MRLLEVKQPNIIVVYGGGFQPFHEGHASSYREAKAAFPGAHFFVAASNVTTERPFEFKEKQFLAQQAGVVDPFIQVGTMSYVNDNGRKVTSTPLNPLEVLQKFNPERDVLVIVRSERDPMKTTDTSYYQPWTGVQNALPFNKHAYIFVTKKHDFSIAGNPVYSGSQVRELYSSADDKTKLSILQDLYPQSRQLDKIKKIFDKRLAVSESLNEFAPDDGSGGEEDALLKYARMWYNGDLGTQQQVEQVLARMGWEIGELESEEGGAFVVQSGDENGDSYIGFAVTDLEEATSLSTMRDYFAGDEKAHDPLEITKQRLYYDPKAVANKRKEFRTPYEYQQWLKKHNLKQITDSEEYNLEEEAANLLEYLRKIHKRWAIVSKKEGRPLVYFKGDGKPSKDWVEKQERRINYFKHKK